MPQSSTVHMLWVKGPLSRLARLSFASFKKQGFDVTLWSYDKSVSPHDASEIVPLTDDMAVLSSLFRYRLLAVKGGIWSDMDVVALAGAETLPDGSFIASERRRPFRHRELTATGESLTQVTNCFMGNPRAGGDGLWWRAAAAVESLPDDERSWESVGPHMLSRLMLETPDHGVTILPPGITGPVAWWNIPAYFLEDREPPSSPFVHMYASIWHRHGIDAEKSGPEESLIERLCRAHGV